DTAAGEQHAFLWEAGTMTDLGTLGGTFSQAFAINGQGQVVGRSSITGAGRPFHAFLWEAGRMTDLGTFGADESQAFDINDRVQVVGRTEAGASPIHAFCWDRSTTSDGRRAQTFGINTTGHVVGVARIRPGGAGPGH